MRCLSRALPVRHASRTGLRRAIMCAAAALFVQGCTSQFNEHHFFKSENDKGEAVNYYRVTVEGSTLLSSSRYVSGYYEEGVIDAYFNTISQPTDGALRPTSKQPEPDNSTDPKPGEEKPAEGKDTKTVTVKPLADEANRKLVLLLSSNSDEIAKGLGAMAQSSQIAETLSNFVASDRFKQANAAGAAADIGTTRGEVLIAEGNRILELVKDGPKDTGAKLLNYANELASLIGPHTGFKSFEDIQAWLLIESAKEAK